MKKDSTKILFFFFLLLTNVVFAQVLQKQVSKQSQAWFSINTTAKIYRNWGFSLDIHERRNHFLKDPSFHFVRFGINYWLKENCTIAAGYSHLWLAQDNPLWKTFAQEHRIQQQIQLALKMRKVAVLQRIRNEQRWQQKMLNDKATGDYKFTERVRYLISFTIPVFKNPTYPTLVLSDELLTQFGKEIIYNSFDQNRFFIGIKQKITKDLNVDFGYMHVYQQKSTGFQYDENNTLRCFFYYNPDLRKK